MSKPFRFLHLFILFLFSLETRHWFMHSQCLLNLLIYPHSRIYWSNTQSRKCLSNSKNLFQITFQRKKINPYHNKLGVPPIRLSHRPLAGCSGGVGTPKRRRSPPMISKRRMHKAKTTPQHLQMLIVSSLRISNPFITKKTIMKLKVINPVTRASWRKAKKKKLQEAQIHCLSPRGITHFESFNSFIWLSTRKYFLIT